MPITLSPETEAKVCEQARRTGENPDSLVEAYVKNMLAWEERDLQESLEVIDRGMEAAEAG